MAVGDFLQGFKEIQTNFNFLTVGAELLWFVLIAILSVMGFKETKDKLLIGLVLSAAFVTVGWITTVYSITIIGGLTIFTIVWNLKE